MDRKVAVIGLDCADPVLVFDRWLDDLPNIRGLVKSGVWGRLRSTDPPITVPAWMSMVTGKDPGQLGIYGFRNRKDYSYDSMTYANSRLLKEKAVWDIVGEHGGKSILIGIPMTYPPRPVNGWMVSGFLTPDSGYSYSWPDKLKEEIEQVVGEYRFDVENFSPDHRDQLLNEIYEMTDKRFTLARHMLGSRDWDFFMMVEMGVDRIQHGFWKYLDGDGRYANAIKEYYMHLDGLIGKLLELFGDAAVFVVSDHGARKMEGGIAINEWLIREGYLVLKERKVKPHRLRNEDIDFEKTAAWGYGGYYGRIFLNVKGREKNGTVGDYERVRDELARGLESLTDENGKAMGNTVLKPEEAYESVRNIPPDLLVYFGNLSWRAVETVGTGSIYTYGEKSWPYDANHSLYGIYIRSGEGIRGSIRKDENISGIAPAILYEMGIGREQITLK